jgi:maleylpyruvate isomerase
VIKLFGWPISSAFYRACVALDLKAISYEPVLMDPDLKEHLEPAYLDVNPQGLVPALVDGDLVLTQTMAIMEYLEEVSPRPPLLPNSSQARARVRSLAEICNCEIHPIINRRVRLYLADDFGHTPEEVTQWLSHWYGKSFAILEKLLANDSATGRYCHGDTPTVADIYLVSLLSAAQIYDVDVSSYTTLLRIEAACLENPEFRERLPRLLAS